MKKINKITAISLTLAMLLSLTACGDSGEGGGNGGNSGNNSSGGDNTAPEIAGAADQTVEAGSEFNALAGLTATDAEDGDLTAKIMIDCTPSLDFNNGVAVPDKAGSYEITYSVTDKGGLTAEAYATLTVTKQTGEAVEYKTFDFSTPQTVDSKGWTANVADGVDASGELKEGAYVFDINSPGNGDGDIQLVKTGLALKPASYKVKVWAKSTADTYAHIIARDESVEEWTAFGGTYNAVIGKEITPLELNFSTDKEGSAELMINLGKITPNPENPDDTTPENFKVTIDKIEVYEITGAENETPVYENDMSAADESALAVSAGDGAAASTSGNTVKIDAYPTEGGVWSIKADIALPGVSVEEGKKYYYSFKVKSSNAQSGECLIESATQNDQQRANFNGLSLAAGEETVVTNKFTAEKSVSDPVIRMQIGAPSDGVSSNELVITDVVFGTLDGDLDTAKTIYSFNAFGAGTANESNPELPWMTFNGSDEDNEGVGTIWTENGSLFYRIDKGGTVDWHNKLVCGYNENPLVLASDSYYTIEITAKADKNVSCGFFLNTLGGWDPRISENMDITTEEQTFTFETKDTFITDMNFEMLFQFGSDATAQLGEVTVEISDIKILQKSVG